MNQPSITVQEVQKALNEIKIDLTKVSENSEYTIKQTDNLKIILLNLQIESARIHEANGIKPIALALQKIISELHDSTLNITTKARKSIVENLHIINKYIIEQQ